MKEEIFQLAIIELLYIYMMFAINSPNFSLASLKKIIVCKNNSMYVSLNPSFNIPIFFDQSDRLDELF